MSCGGCGKRAARKPADAPDYGTGPGEACVFCAEKHLAFAAALAQECGYVPVNLQWIIGELVACQWHLFRTHGAFAAKIRSARHALQHRDEDGIDWSALLSEMDAIASAEAENEKKEMRT